MPPDNASAGADDLKGLSDFIAAAKGNRRPAPPQPHPTSVLQGPSGSSPAIRGPSGSSSAIKGPSGSSSAIASGIHPRGADVLSARHPRAHSDGTVLRSPTGQMRADGQAGSAGPSGLFGNTMNVSPQSLRETARRDNQLVEQSNVVIQRQRESIVDLQRTVDDLETQRAQIAVRHSEEVAVYIEENERLRLQLDALQAEVAALSESQVAQELTVQSLTEKLYAAEQSLADRDARINRMQQTVGMLPEENIRLKEDVTRLQNEMDQYKEAAEAVGHFSPRKAREMQEELHNSRAEIAKLQRLAEEADRRSYELEMTRRAIVQIESDSFEYKTAIEEQRREIERLNKVIESLNKQKALVPPVVLAAPGVTGLEGEEISELRRKIFAMKTGEEAEQDLENLFAAIKAELGSGDGGRGGGRGLAEQQLRALEEQRKQLFALMKALEEISNRQLELMDRDLRHFTNDPGVYYVAKVLHTKVDNSRGVPPGFRERIMAVKRHEILFYDSPDVEVPFVVLQTVKTTAIPDAENLQIVLEYRAVEHVPPEIHIVKLKDADEFNRWHHALNYAGCLRSPLEDLLKKRDEEDASRRRSDVADTLCTVISVSGIRPDGGRLPFVHESLVLFVVDTNMVKVPVSEDRPLDFLASIASCRIDPTEKSFVVSIASDTHEPNFSFRIVPKSAHHFEKMAGEAVQMKWKDITVGNDLTPIKVVEPPPPVPPPPIGLPITFNCAGGLGLDGVTPLPNSISTRAIFDVPTNTVEVAIPGADPLLASAQHVTCRVDPDTRTFELMCYPEGNVNATPVPFSLQAADHETFNSLMANAEKMNWLGFTVGPPPPPPEPPTEDNTHLFVVANRQLKLFEKEGDADPVLRLLAEECFTVADEANMEFHITQNPGSTDEELFVFAFDDMDTYLEKKRLLEENGFFDKIQGQEEGKTKRVNQVCVVQKGKLEAFLHYGEPDDAPIITLRAAWSKARASEERREIRIVHQNPSGKKERVTLDCASKKEFDRWKIALLFGGFLKEDMSHTAEKSKALNNLTKYMFPINLFRGDEDTQSKGLKCVRVEGDVVCIFPLPDSERPIFTFPKDRSNCAASIERRRFRFFRDRYTADEDRCDILMNLAAEFDKLNAELEKSGFITASAAPAKQPPPTSPYLVAKMLSLAIFEERSKNRPMIILSALDYVGEIDAGALAIHLRPRAEGEEFKSEMDHVQRQIAKEQPTPLDTRIKMPSFEIMLTEAADFERYKFALFVSMIVPFPEPPRFFLPVMMYGFSSRDFPLQILKQRSNSAKPWKRLGLGSFAFNKGETGDLDGSFAASRSRSALASGDLSQQGSMASRAGKPPPVPAAKQGGQAKAGGKKGPKKPKPPRKAPSRDVNDEEDEVYDLKKSPSQQESMSSRPIMSSSSAIHRGVLPPQLTATTTTTTTEDADSRMMATNDTADGAKDRGRQDKGDEKVLLWGVNAFSFQPPSDDVINSGRRREDDEEGRRKVGVSSDPEGDEIGFSEGRRSSRSADFSELERVQGDQSRGNGDLGVVKERHVASGEVKTTAGGAENEPPFERSTERAGRSSDCGNKARSSSLTRFVGWPFGGSRKRKRAN